MILGNADITITHAVTREETRVREWKKEILELPPGSLYSTSTSGRTFFYHSHQGKRRGISKEEDLIYALARKKYLKLMIKEHVKVLDIAARGIHDRRSRGKSMTVSLPLEKLLNSYVSMGLDLARITCSDRQYQWMKKPYVGNPVNPEAREYKTHSGIGVRSKSEQSIGNALEKKGIPYRYEQGFRVSVEWMEDADRIEKIYYPDFTILTTAGKYIIWEHLGRVDKLDYRIHNIEKISAYRQSGFLGEEQMILTFEKDMMDLDTIDRIIRNRIIPYL